MINIRPKSRKWKHLSKKRKATDKFVMKCTAMESSSRIQMDHLLLSKMHRKESRLDPRSRCHNKSRQVRKIKLMNSNNHYLMMMWTKWMTLADIYSSTDKERDNMRPEKDDKDLYLILDMDMKLSR